MPTLEELEARLRAVEDAQKSKDEIDTLDPKAVLAAYLRHKANPPRPTLPPKR